MALRLQSIQPDCGAAACGPSASKQTFLSGVSTAYTDWPTVQQYESLSDDLERKHKIRILINGDGTMLLAAREAWLAERKEILSSDHAYAAVRNSVLQNDLSLHEGLEFRSQFRKYADFGTPCGIKFGQESSFADAIKCHPKYAALFARAIKRALSDAAHDSLNVGLCADGAAQDIAINVVSLAGDQGFPIGYMRSAFEDGQGTGTGRAHYDPLIILPNGRVIAPIYYDLRSYQILASKLEKEHGLPVAATNLNAALGCHGGNAKVPHPLATQGGCGSLGISYLKEYLKDGGAQMRDYCLLVERIRVPGENKPASFLLPSPQVLRYSQSSRFNAVIQAMVDPAPSLKALEHKRETLTVPTLAEMAAAGATISSIGGQVLSGEELSAFCKRWQNEFKTFNAKRDGMTKCIPGQDGHADSAVNFYLAHVQDRHVRRTSNSKGAQTIAETMFKA